MSGFGEPNTLAKLEAWSVCAVLKETIEKTTKSKKDWEVVDAFQQTALDGDLRTAMKYRDRFEDILRRYAPYVEGGLGVSN